MNMFHKPEVFAASPQLKLLNDLNEKHPDLIAGAVEYAFQRGDISAGEYRQWQNRITEMERQRTNALLDSLKA